jgi:hypothetical protein|tara:strand:+ start:1468 stop:2169 length:702 start_codon:yes stop_codon:yes gene_type:complete
MGGRMNALNSVYPSQLDAVNGTELKVRRAAQSSELEVLTEIYREDTNIVVWQRQLSETLKNSVDAFVGSNPTFQTSMTLTPQRALSSVRDALGDSYQDELSENIAELVDMFCCLFELKRAGLRLATLDRAMCPRFHFDKIPCRLVTTFQGIATEWLPHQVVNREKLGVGNNGKPDSTSGVYKSTHDIQRISSGDIALLKGELWQGNEGAGLVHRSPEVPAGQRRLLLTLDFSD